MKINRRSYHAKIYLWWYRTKYETSEERTTANLCPYVRVVLLWAPMRFLFLGGLHDYFSFALYGFLLVVVPKLAGYLSYDLKKGLWITEGVITFYALVIGLGVFIGCYNNRDRSLPKRIAEALDKSSEVALLKAYLRAAHDRVCPELHLN